MKITNKLIPITPYYMFCRQVADTTDAIRAQQAGVERFFPMQFGGLFGQKTIMDLEEVMSMTEFDGAEGKKPGQTPRLIKGD